MPRTRFLTANTLSLIGGSHSSLDPAFLQKLDGELVTALPGAGDSDRLVCSNFGFGPGDVPDRATIDAIVFEVYGYGSSGVAPERQINARPTPDLGATVPLFPVAKQLVQNARTPNLIFSGGTASTNGSPIAWTPQIIRSSSFALLLSKTSAYAFAVNYDLVQVAIDYTVLPTGYEIAPVVRIVPENGMPERLDLRALISDHGGQPFEVRPRYRLIQDNRTTINVSLRPYKRGFRPEVRMRFQVSTMAQDVVLTQIENACLDPRVKVFLSLDAGQSEREVMLRNMTGPESMGGKSFIGQVVELHFVALHVTPTKPSLHEHGPASW